LNLWAFRTEVVPPKVIAAILRGGAAKAKEAVAALIVGGHSIRNPEPFTGLSVTGVSPRRMITNAAARPGDWLVLTTTGH